MIDRRVDFPQPEGPSKATISPEWISKVIPAKTCLSAKALNIFVILSAGGPFNIIYLSNKFMSVENQFMVN
jgi:hypothetical protein